MKKLKAVKPKLQLEKRRITALKPVVQQHVAGGDTPPRTDTMITAVSGCIVNSCN